MEVQKIIQFLRITFQGISIASLGTLGITPSWGGAIVGVITFIVAFTLVTFEKDGE